MKGVNASIWNRICLVLSGAGVFVAGFLTISHVLGKQMPCGGTGDCARVAMHPSSQWFGIPVAAFGLIAYLLLFLLSVARFSATGKRFGTLAMAGLLVSAVGFGASLYLTYVSLFVIQAACQWCLASAVIMVATFMSHAEVMQSDTPEARSENGMSWIGAVAILVLGGLGAGYTNLQGQASYGKSVEDLAKTLTPDMVVLSDRHFKGPKDAPITIVEFADFYCPSCRDSYKDIVKIEAQYGTKVRFGFSNYPLFDKEGHEQSLMAAAATIYADERGKYWELVDKLFKLPLEDISGEANLLAVLRDFGFDTADFFKRFSSADSKLLDPLSSIQAQAAKYGVDRTPTWIVFAKGLPTRYVSRSLSDALDEPQYQALLK